MPPSKRSSSRDDEAVQNSPTGSAAKRRRVSLACNPCRAAREKCDGERPHCGSCASQHRNCTYTVSSKKRGVQTGYLRTIELALAWVLEEVPESEHALQRLLTDNGGREGAKVLTRKNSTGHHLHKKWNRSRVHKAIARLLTDGDALCQEEVPGESDSGRDDGNTPTASSLRSENVEGNDGLQAGGASFQPTPTEVRLKLPRDWQRLVDIYHSYTHCWLPLIDKTSLLATASTYPPNGFSGNQSSLQGLPSDHLELWAVMALASFQDKESHKNKERDASPAALFSISQKLISSRQDAPDWAHTRATLLHSLILIGQGNFSAAWLLVGTATRASLFLRTFTVGTSSPRSQTHQIQQAVTVTACSVLDIWLSLTLGQHPQMRSDSHDIWQPDHILGSICNGEDESWNAVSGFKNSSPEAETPEMTVSQPFSTLLQLSKFSRVINLALGSSHALSGAKPMVPEDLTKSLDPKFAFCNSLMSTTPGLPSAFVLQAAFLAGTVALSSTCRSSVFSTFTEVVENTLSSFGASGTPPFMQILMDFMQKQAKTNSLRPTMGLLREVWIMEPASAGQPRGRAGSLWSDDRQGWPDGREHVVGEGHDGQQHLKAPASLPTNYMTPHSDFQSTTIGPTTTLDAFLPLQGSNASYDTPRTDRLYTIPTPQSGYGQTQMVDYDSILDQLGSIDCTDSIELDPQFMVNLGFAPGCGFGDPGFDES